MNYRHDIDGLRAVAVSLIVLFHLGVSELSGGFVGVDVFFVISGFLITKLVLKEVETGTFRYRDFYLRRLRRLGPSLLSVLFLTLVAGYFILSIFHFEELALSTVAAVFSGSNILFWVQADYFDTSSIFKPLLHTWSLSVEEQFYLIWPASLILLARVSSLKIRACILAAASVASLLAAEVFLNRDPAGAFFLPVFRIYEFAFGAALAMFGLAVRKGAVAHATSVTGLACIAYAGILFSEEMRFPGISALLPCVGTALLISSGPKALVNKALTIAPFRYVGRISYSLYLVHWPIVVYFNYLYDAPDTVWETSILLVGSLGLGAFLYHFVETPFRKKAGGEFKVSNRRLGYSSMFAAIVVVAASAVVVDQNGLPKRSPPEIQNLLAEISNGKRERRIGIRRNSCHFKADTSQALAKDFSPCLPSDQSNAIVIFGDSHAADVWMGVSKSFPNRNFVQFTGAGCSLSRTDTPNGHCSVMLDVATKWISQNADSIDAVVYSQRAAHMMDGDPVADVLAMRTNFDQLDRVRTKLEGILSDGVPIYFWGPRPEFHPVLQVVVTRNPTLKAIQKHYQNADISVFHGLDDDLEQYFSDHPVTYVSSIKRLCDPECSFALPDGIPVFLDYAHWSPGGAAFSAEKVVQNSDILKTLFRAGTH